MKLIPDEEILLNADNDLLSQKIYVSTLKKVISNVPLDVKDSFTIGFFGEWGSGKSSIIKTLEKDYNNENKGKHKFIIYDAWKYVNDSFRRMFLLKLQQELNFDKSELMNSFYLNEAEDVGIKKKGNWSFIIVTILFALVIILIVLTSNTTTTEFKITLAIIVTVVGSILNAYKSTYDELKINIHKPHLFAPEQFEECFNEIIEKSFTGDTVFKKINKWVQGKSSHDKLDKIIIVIDNIDRCQKELAYELLTNIKNFLGKNKNVIFIIPVDDDALKKHIQYSTKDDNSTEANEFLRKFFNVTLRLKKLKRYDIYSYAKKINDKYSLGFNSTTIDIIGKEFASNPRRIIQLYNNLNAEFENYDKKFVELYESVICKFIILREEWSQYYDQICGNPFLINAPDKKTKQLIDNSFELDRFLKKTNSITQNVSLRIINKILMNEDDLKEIPDAVMDAIESIDEDVILDFIKDSPSKFSLVIDSIIEELKNMVDNDRKLSALNYFKSLLVIHNISEIEVYDNFRIQNEIEFYLPTFLSDGCDEYNAELIQYSEYLDARNCIYLKKYLLQIVIDDYNSINYEKVKISSKNLLVLMLETYKDVSVSKLQKALLLEFKNSNNDLSDLIKDEKIITKVIDKEFKDYVFNSIKEVSENDRMIRALAYLSNEYIFQKDDYESLFEKINLLHPTFNNIPKEGLISIIKLLNKLFLKSKAIRENILNLKTFYDAIMIRKIANVATRLSQEVVNDSNDLKEFLSFLFNVYRLTNNNTSTHEEFSELYENNISYSATKDIIMGLKNSDKFSLAPLHDIIMKDNNYDNKTLDLLGYIFIYKSNDKYSLSDKDLENKLNEIINLILTNEDNELLVEFIKSHISDKRIEGTLISIITKKSKDDIIKLPANLQNLAFDYICSDNRLIVEYADELELLRAIAINGKEEHIKELTKVIVEKLIRQDSKTAYELIDLTNNFSNSDKQKILYHLEDYTEIEESHYILENAKDKLRGQLTTSIFELRKENNNNESEST